MHAHTETLFETFEALRPTLLRFASTLLDNRDDAEDVMQNVALNILRLRPDIHPQDAPQYLYRAIRNGVHRWYRKGRVQTCPLIDCDRLAPGPEVQVMENALSDPLAAAYDGLPDDLRDVLWHVCVQQEQDTAYARRIGSTRGAVSMRLCRARRAMRCALDSGSVLKE